MLGAPTCRNSHCIDVETVPNHLYVTASHLLHCKDILRGHLLVLSTTEAFFFFLPNASSILVKECCFTNAGIKKQVIFRSKDLY